MRNANTSATKPVSLRELDVLVAKHIFGIEVLPEWCPAQPWEDTVGEWRPTPSDSWNDKHPVYVKRCMCEGHRQRWLEAIQNYVEVTGGNKEDVAVHMAEYDAQYFAGHYRQCLEVVPFYTSEDNDYKAVIVKMVKDGYVYQLQYLPGDHEIYGVTAWFIHGDTFEADAATESEAVIKAALAAKGIQV